MNKDKQGQRRLEKDEQDKQGQARRNKDKQG